MSDSEIRWVGDLQRCVAKPGDRFVLTLANPLTDQAIHRIKEHWRAFAGDDVLLLILEPGMKLGVIAADEG